MQTYRPTNLQTYRVTYRPLDLQTCRPTNLQTYRVTYRPLDLQTYSLQTYRPTGLQGSLSGRSLHPHATTTILIKKIMMLRASPIQYYPWTAFYEMTKVVIVTCRCKEGPDGTPSKPICHHHHSDQKNHDAPGFSHTMLPLDGPFRND